MGMLKFEVPHKLSKDEAKQRVTQLLERWNKEHGLQSTWNGDRAKLVGKAMGLSINAELEVSGDRVGGEATDPGFLFRDKAKKYLTQKFDAYLDPAGPREND